MARFEINICLVEEVEDLVRYIHENWSENHILFTSRALLDWQHKSKCGNYYNFVIARSIKSKKICGVLGFIPSSHFSNALHKYKEVWPVLWIINEGPSYVGLGFALFNFLIKEYGFKSIYSISISESSLPIYEKMGFSIGYYSQLAIINSNLNNYQIASIDNKFKAPRLTEDKHYNLCNINENSVNTELSDPNLYGYSVIKNVDYFINRYLKHPIFNYRFFGIYRDLKLCAFIVTRVVKHKQRSVIRVVDIQGDVVSITKTTKQFHDMLVKENHEYIDIMQFGLPEKLFIKSGFVKAESHKNIVIPDYFEPFVRNNIKIIFARKTEKLNNQIIMFKGDADQDRPNKI